MTAPSTDCKLSYSGPDKGYAYSPARCCTCIQSPLDDFERAELGSKYYGPDWFIEAGKAKTNTLDSKLIRGGMTPGGGSIPIWYHEGPTAAQFTIDTDGEITISGLTLEVRFSATNQDFSVWNGVECQFACDIGSPPWTVYYCPSSSASGVIEVNGTPYFNQNLYSGQGNLYPWHWTLTAGTYATLDDLTIWSVGRTGCPSVTNCGWFPATTEIYDEMSVTINGIIEAPWFDHSGCADCPSLNGTYILERTDDVPCYNSGFVYLASPQCHYQLLGQSLSCGLTEVHLVVGTGLGGALTGSVNAWLTFTGDNCTNNHYAYFVSGWYGGGPPYDTSPAKIPCGNSATSTTMVGAFQNLSGGLTKCWITTGGTFEMHGVS